jgi:hypothetical protein
MARHIGRSGTVSIGGVAVGYCTSWTYDESADEIEVTAMGDSSKVYIGGLTEGSGSVDCRYDGADAGQEDVLDALAAGTEVVLALYTGAKYFTGNTVVTSISVGASYDDSVSLSFGYRGALTASDTE